MTEHQREYMRNYMREYRKTHAEATAAYMRRCSARAAAKNFPAQMWIAEERRARGLTQAYVAAACGTNQPTISRLESGRLSLTGFSGREKLLELLGGER